MSIRSFVNSTRIDLHRTFNPNCRSIKDFAPSNIGDTIYQATSGVRDFSRNVANQGFSRAFEMSLDEAALKAQVNAGNRAVESLSDKERAKMSQRDLEKVWEHGSGMTKREIKQEAKSGSSEKKMWDRSHKERVRDLILHNLQEQGIDTTGYTVEIGKPEKKSEKKAAEKKAANTTSDLDRFVEKTGPSADIDIEPEELKEYKPRETRLAIPDPVDILKLKDTPEEVMKKVSLSKKRVRKLLDNLHVSLPGVPEFLVDCTALVALYTTEQIDLERLYQFAPETDPDDDDPDIMEIINLIGMILNDMPIKPEVRTAEPASWKALYSSIQNTLRFMRGYEKIITTTSAGIFDNMIEKVGNLLLKLDKKEEKAAKKAAKKAAEAAVKAETPAQEQDQEEDDDKDEEPTVKRKAQEPITNPLDFVDPNDPSKVISHMNTISQIVFNNVQKELQKIFNGLELNVTINRTTTGLIVIGVVRDPVMRVTEYFYVDPGYVIGNGYNLMAMANTPEGALGYVWVNLKHIDLCRKVVSTPGYILTPEELRLVKADQFDDAMIYNFVDMTRPKGTKKWIGSMSFDERKALGNVLHAIINLDDWDTLDKPFMVTTRLRFSSYTDANHFTLVADLQCKSPVMSWRDVRGEHWGSVDKIASDTQITVVDNVITYQRNGHMLNFDMVYGNN